MFLKEELMPITHVLSEHAKRSPEKTAYTYLLNGEDCEASLNYSELNQKVSQLAHRLRSFAVEGDRAILLFSHGLEFIVTFLACLRAGIIAVPAYPPKRNYSIVRLEAILEDSQPSVVLVEQGSRSVLDELENQYQILEISIEEEVEPGSSFFDDVTGEQIAFLQYTSGTTELPKGVMVSHRNIVANEHMIQSAFDHNADSVLVGWLPFYHDMGLIGNLLQPLFVGAHGVFFSPYAFMQKPKRWLEAVSKYRATTSGGPNFAYQLCVERIADSAIADLDLSSWKVAFNGSEMIRDSTLKAFSEKFQHVGFRKSAFFPCYGLAESTLMVSGGRVQRDFVSGESLSPGDRVLRESGATGITLVGSGEVVHSSEVCIVDPDTLTLFPQDTIGEIWVSGEHIAKGYWNRSEQSQDTFNQQIEGQKGVYLRTGDIGYLSEGNLYIVGRIKELFKIRGRVFYPQYIEADLFHLDDILKADGAAVFTIDEGLGSEALIVAHEISAVESVEYLQQLCHRIRKSVLNKHDLVVKTVLLVRSWKLPRSSSGKIQRHRCSEMFQKDEFSVVARCDYSAMSEDVSEAFELELESVDESLLDFISSALGVEKVELKPSTSLIALGIDSVQITAFIQALEKRYQLQLDFNQVYDGMTIGEMIEFSRVSIQSKERLENSILEEQTYSEDKNWNCWTVSPQQEGLWWQSRVQGDAEYYIINRALKVGRLLEPERLKAAFIEVVKRHPALRSVTVQENGVLYGRIDDPNKVEFLFEKIDCASDQRIKETCDEWLNRPFDLEEAFPIRMGLFELPEAQSVVAVSVHHIAVDFWSLQIFIQQLFDVYDVGVCWTDSEVEESHREYIRGIQNQKNALNGDIGEKSKQYWLSSCRGVQFSLAELQGHQEILKSASSVERVDFQLPEKVSGLAERFSVKHQATIYQVFLSIYLSLVHRYSGSEAICAGTVLSGRNFSKSSELIGFFANPVPCVVNISISDAFLDVLEQVKGRVKQMMPNQGYPFAHLQHAIKKEEKDGQLFDNIFVLQSAHKGSLKELNAVAINDGSYHFQWKDITFQNILLEKRGAPEFGFVFSMAEVGNTYRGVIEYDGNAYSEDFVRQFSEHFAVFADMFLKDSKKSIRTLPLQPEAIAFDEKITNEKSAHFLERFETVLKSSPDKIALSCGETNWTYHHLDEVSERIACFLVQNGLPPEGIVPLIIKRNNLAVAMMIGVMKAGCCFLPLSVNTPEQRLVDILEQVNPSIVLSQRGTKEDAKLNAESCCQIENILCEIEAVERLKRVGVHEHQAAYVIYTSGSTGKPKGVVIEYHGLSNLIQWHLAEFKVSRNDVASVYTDWGVDASLWEVFPYLANGNQVVFMPEEVRYGSNDIENWLAENQITHCFLPSPTFNHIADSFSGEKTSLKYLLVGGDRLKQSPLECLRPCLVNNYGPTENSVVSTFEYIEQDKEKKLLIGKPIEGVGITVRDRCYGKLPTNVKGELYVSGRGLARGYLKHPSQTATVFVPYPEGRTGERMYRTGDIVVMNPGRRLAYVARDDGQVKVNGIRVELVEIQNAIRSFHEIAMVEVLYDKEDELLVAYFSLNKGAIAGEGFGEKIYQHLQCRLMNSLIPSRFILLEEMPLTTLGKVDRSRLMKSEGKRVELRQPYVEASNDIERNLVATYLHILKLDKVSVKDNFFEIGGDSLLSGKLQVELKKQWGYELEVVELFQNPTIEQLANFIQDRHKGMSAIMEKGNRRAEFRKQKGRRRRH